MVLDRLAVRFGVELTKLIPEDVATEVDALLSSNREVMIAKARSLIGLYEAQSVGRDRVLIKLAAMWEGICAAEVLEREGTQFQGQLRLAKWPLGTGLRSRRSAPVC